MRKSKTLTIGVLVNFYLSFPPTFNLYTTQPRFLLLQIIKNFYLECVLM